MKQSGLHQLGYTGYRGERTVVIGGIEDDFDHIGRVIHNQILGIAVASEFCCCFDPQSSDQPD